jgi:HSP20 family molecular chaperone IbpA
MRLGASRAPRLLTARRECKDSSARVTLLILADVPGVAADGFSIKLDREQLTIDARRTLVPSGEQPFDYQRVFVVPNGIDADQIAATLQNGVLRLVLPKPAALKPRQIEVKAG